MSKQEKKYTGYDIIKSILGDNAFELPDGQIVDGDWLDQAIYHHRYEFHYDTLKNLFLTGEKHQPTVVMFDEDEFKSHRTVVLYGAITWGMNKDLFEFVKLVVGADKHLSAVSEELLTNKFEWPVKKLTSAALYVLAMRTPDRLDMSYWSGLVKDCSDAMLTVTRSRPVGTMGFSVGIRMPDSNHNFAIAWDAPITK